MWGPNLQYTRGAGQCIGHKTTTVANRRLDIRAMALNGLRLEPGVGPEDFFVLDRAQKPTGN